MLGDVAVVGTYYWLLLGWQHTGFPVHSDVHLIRVADRRRYVPSNSVSAVVNVRNDVKLPNPFPFLNPSLDAMEFPNRLMRCRALARDG